MGQRSERIKPSSGNGAKRQGERRHIRGRAGQDWKAAPSWMVSHLSSQANLGGDLLRSRASSALLVEGLPATMESCLLLGRDRPVGTLVTQEGEAETVGFVGGMDDSESLVESALASIEVGTTDGRAVW